MHNRLYSPLGHSGGVGKGWEVKRKKHIFARDWRLGVPDLIFVKGDSLLVVDVTVRHDGGMDWLIRGHSEKVKKYKPFLNMLGL